LKHRVPAHNLFGIIMLRTPRLAHIHTEMAPILHFTDVYYGRSKSSPELGETMESMARDSEGKEIPEQRLWRAVIASTVEEWIHGPLRKKREAEQFLFVDENDYRTVCFSAGIDPSNLRERLQKIRSRQDAEKAAHASRN
jgi:hypothetical protein